MKKLYLFLLFVFFNSLLWAQMPVKQGFHLDSLPADVTGQWRFHAGDNPAWADTAFNDSKWPSINAATDSHLITGISHARIGWFRLRINVTPKLRGKTIGIKLSQYGAAEIYFNGVLIRTLGKVSADIDNEQTRFTRREPINIQLNAAPVQYLVVRYAFARTGTEIGNGYHLIRVTFETVESTWDDFFDQIDVYTTRAWVSGSVMLLAILQICIYFFNRKRKVNLYLAVYAFLQMLTLSDGLTKPIFRSTNFAINNLIVFNIASPLCFIFFLAMTYAFFNYRMGIWFRIYTILALPVIIIQFIGDGAQNEFVLAAYGIGTYLTIITVSIKAVRQRKAGAGLFLAGIIVTLFFFLLFNAGSAINQPLFLTSLEVGIAFLTPGIILSILLAKEFVLNLVALQHKLAEVEALSARALQQEMEKQQLLSKQNEILEQRVEERTTKLNLSLTELKATQTQLIQSEKMASLGELTAGIAHEIQNPLNFVNNFSEVSAELIDEVDEELAKGDIEEARAIAADVKQNLEKIRHHGKRADSIVKGMLEHSKVGTGKKVPTDINALADEFLKLSYHGLRAKDKNFNAELITNFDEQLPKVNIAQQDIGRVLLNLFNNAFYAVNQKQKTAGADYKPTVEITTFAPPSGGWGAKVKDNGNGIPDAIKDKIMQPFFTTKPTGEGTGLGLSLSYDIVVKGHNGSITVDTKENEFTEFTVTIPIS
jgi:two-component system NtrC family sensor kinase